MNYKIDGYSSCEVIKKYQKLDDKLVVTYLDGSNREYDLSDENNILVLMEKQGEKYASSFDNIDNYCLNVVSGSSGLVLLLVGTLSWIRAKCTGEPLSGNELILFSGFGSVGVATEVILLRKMLFKFAYVIGLLDDKEKYNYYFRNKELLGECISINDLDNYSLSYLREMLKDDNNDNSKKKSLKRKR